jgi:3-deoxy-7-phosphoheptulonate synthase
MLIIMHVHATPQEIEHVIERVAAFGLTAHVSAGAERTIIGAIGEGAQASKHLNDFIPLPGVDRVVPISRPYKLASREFSPQDTIFPLDGISIGAPTW